MTIDPKLLPPQYQKQILEKLAKKPSMVSSSETSGRRKYNNTATTRNGENGAILRFDSKREAARYDELMLMLHAGLIRDLKLQPEFTLQEAYTTLEGKRIRAIRYRADFSYREMRLITDNMNSHIGDVDKLKLVVEDVKSEATKTQQYKMKKKIMQEKFGISVQEVE